jgi:hypothetical protein
MKHGDVRPYYLARWGMPDREARFTKDLAEVSVLTWGPSSATEGVTLYATVENSDTDSPTWNRHIGRSSSSA